MALTKVRLDLDGVHAVDGVQGERGFGEPLRAESAAGATQSLRPNKGSTPSDNVRGEADIVRGAERFHEETRFATLLWREIAPCTIVNPFASATGPPNPNGRLILR